MLKRKMRQNCGDIRSGQFYQPFVWHCSAQNMPVSPTKLCPTLAEHTTRSYAQTFTLFFLCAGHAPERLA